MKIIEALKSSDSTTTKFIQMTLDGTTRVETTYVDYCNKHIICFATQVGCNYGCTFCANGLAHNFRRNLECGEIFAQCQTVIDYIKLGNKYDLPKPFLFSAMGCGDPLANPENLEKAFYILHKIYPDSKFALATTGKCLDNFFPLMDAIDRMELNFKLTVSLHSAIGDVRKRLLPICEGDDDLNALMDTLKNYQRPQGKMPRHVEYNVVLFQGINDSKDDAKAIYKLLESRDLLDISTIKINKYNPVPRATLKPSDKVNEFVGFLKDLGAPVEVYETNGSDVGAACGQLVAY